MCTDSLNRTFYGIETTIYYLEICLNYVLIVPFMELKLLPNVLIAKFLLRLNRTFYGIET